MRCPLRSLRRLAVPVVVGTLLGGCGFFSSEEVATPLPEVPSMEVTANLADIHRCSRISPELQIVNPPRGVERYDVRLIEHGDSDTFLGGGSWPADESGIIPEGVLTRHYRGPCPPTDHGRDYSFEVSAMGKHNMQPLEVRIYRFTQE